MKKYISINVDTTIADRLKITAAKQEWMRYSFVAEGFLQKAYKEIDNINSYNELKER